MKWVGGMSDPHTSSGDVLLHILHVIGVHEEEGVQIALGVEATHGMVNLHLQLIFKRPKRKRKRERN